MVVNGHLKTPCATVELQFEVGYILFKKRFIVMTSLTSPILGLISLQRNSNILDMRQGVIIFPFFSMQLKHADNKNFNINEQLLNPTETLFQPGNQTIIHIKAQV